MEEHRQINETLIAYLAQELSPAESRLIEEWALASEANSRHFHALKDTWQLLLVNKFVDCIDVEIEWRQFQETVDAKTMMNVIDPGMETEPAERKSASGKLRKLLIRVAVAASLVVGVALVWVNLSRTQLKMTDQLTVASKPLDSVSAVFHREVNYTGLPRDLKLDDGTSVKLDNNSELVYRKGFAADRREVRLTGKAHFDVVKDARKPFTVVTDAIRTTALGTSFSVDAVIVSPQMIVRLFEGKVLVSFYAADRNKAENFYLNAGDELIFNKASITARIQKIAGRKSRSASSENKDEPKIINQGDGSWFMFNNQPLSEVLDQLENMYDVDIVYSKKEVSRLYVIGSFRTTDSVQEIIKQIARLNQLKVTSDNGRIFISR